MFFLHEPLFPSDDTSNVISRFVSGEVRMKLRLFLGAVMAWASTVSVFAQAPPIAPPSHGDGPVVAGTSPCVEEVDWVTGLPHNGDWLFGGLVPYFAIDYLLWWMKPVCLKVPILTAGSTADAVPGAVGQPGTTTLVGTSRFEFGPASGFRPRAGMLLTPDGLFALEAGGFDLQTVVNHQGFSTTAGSPRTFLAYQAPDNTQQALPFSIPGVVNGSVAATGTSQLWGAELNGVANLLSGQWGSMRLQASWLAGFRYLDLHDRITLRNSQSLVSNPSVAAFGEDALATHNQFYGAQVGNRLVLSGSRWSLEAVGTLAVGETRLANTFAGAPLAGTPVAAGLIPGPIQVLPSNSGEHSVYRVSLVPEIALRLRYCLTEQVTLSLGYSLLYWNRILCPGDLMDPQVNITQLPGHGPVSGPAVPAVQALHTDYFTQGLNAGLEFRF
jgi:hypothetical protein